jgi:hypothetical protein
LGQQPFGRRLREAEHVGVLSREVIEIEIHDRAAVAAHPHPANGAAKLEHARGDARRLEQGKSARIYGQCLRLGGGLGARFNQPRLDPLPLKEQRGRESHGTSADDQRTFDGGHGDV